MTRKKVRAFLKNCTCTYFKVRRGTNGLRNCFSGRFFLSCWPKNSSRVLARLIQNFSSLALSYPCMLGLVVVQKYMGSMVYGGGGDPRHTQHYTNTPRVQGGGSYWPRTIQSTAKHQGPTQGGGWVGMIRGALAYQWPIRSMSRGPFCTPTWGWAWQAAACGPHPGLSYFLISWGSWGGRKLVRRWTHLTWGTDPLPSQVTPWCWESCFVYLVSLVLTVPCLCPDMYPD